jgi:hypothetical protein
VFVPRRSERLGETTLAQGKDLRECPLSRGQAILSRLAKRTSTILSPVFGVWGRGGGPLRSGRAAGPRRVVAVGLFRGCGANEGYSEGDPGDSRDSAAMGRRLGSSDEGGLTGSRTWM